jgi:hypothetical protein
MTTSWDTDPDPRDDPETALRKRMVAAGVPTQVRQRLERENAEGHDPPHPIYDTAAFRTEFRATGFLAPFVHVIRLSDGKSGMLMFEHDPRWYFGFIADDAASGQR